MTLGKMTKQAFSEPEAARTGPLGWSEPKVNWYLESTRPEAAQDRVAVNEWDSRFPDRYGIPLGRLRSHSDIEHCQALDELLAHHLIDSRLTVRYEEGANSPDFTIYGGGDHPAGMEVVSLFMQRN